MTEYFNGEYYFNVALHVTFLFLFLSAFFIGYVKTLETKAINAEINSIINGSFSDPIILNKIKTIVSKVKTMYDKVDNTQVVNNLQSLLNSDLIKNKTMHDALKSIITTLQTNKPPPTSSLQQVPSEGRSSPSFLIPSELENRHVPLIKNPVSNILNYYATLFSKDDPTREFYNNNLINTIIHIDILLIFILFLFTIVLLKSDSITIIDVGQIVLENFITFFFVGIVEYLFFSNIALYYVPSLPSNLYSGIISNLQSNFNTI
jgi:hypothetical protein